MAEQNDTPRNSSEGLSAAPNASEGARRKRVIANRYQVGERLGSGAAGVVFTAIDLQRDNLPVAVKVLSPLDLKDPTAKLRFEREVELTRQFDHPNLVKVFDFGTMTTGQQYVVMELVAGGTLGRRIYNSAAPLTFPEIAFILRDIITGVSVAHELGIVHRDLKPENILLTEDGTAKVADFGLARNILGGHTITHSAETVGTPYYMAPEQFRNHRIDARADIYSLGIIAFEMVNRKRPFQKEVYTELARAHMVEPMPSFYDKKKPIPRWFETFVFACTEKKPDARFATMQDAGKYLERRLRRMKLLDKETSEREPFFARLLLMLLGEDR